MLTVIEGVVDPLFQVPPTLPISTTLPPSQKVVVVPPEFITDAVGSGFTATVPVALAEHPLPSV